MSEHQTRFKDADWFDPSYNVTVGGAGSIGSWLLLFLSRIGFNIYLYEMDNVETHNIGGQLYGESDVGDPKQSAIRRRVKELAMSNSITSMGKYEEDNIVTPICFSCFDNMKARKDMFYKWGKSLQNLDEESLPLFIDGRLTAESFRMYIVTPQRTEAYKETLFDDSDIESLPCSFKSTSHIAAMLASHMTTGLTNAITNHKHGDIRDIPFETKFEASLFLYEQQFESELPHVEYEQTETKKKEEEHVV